MTKATFGWASTKKLPEALAALLFFRRASSAAVYSLKYFSAEALAVALETTLAFLASTLLVLAASASLVSLACFLRMFSGTTLALLKIKALTVLTLSLPFCVKVINNKKLD